MANLVNNNIISLIAADAQCKQKKSCDELHDDIIDIWHSEKLFFQKNIKKVFNELNFISWIEL